MKGAREYKHWRVHVLHVHAQVGRTGPWAALCAVTVHMTELIGDMKRIPRSRRLDEEQYRFIDELMVENTDLMSRQLYSALKEAYPTIEASLSTVKRAR